MTYTLTDTSAVRESRQTRALAGVPLSGIAARHVGVPLSEKATCLKICSLLLSPGPHYTHRTRPYLTPTQPHQRSAPWVRDPHDPETDSVGLLVELRVLSGYEYCIAAHDCLVPLLPTTHTKKRQTTLTLGDGVFISKHSGGPCTHPG